MSDKLDDRYVEYDLDNSINVLDFAHGGTGTNTLAANGNILIAQATGDPDPNKALKIADSGWGAGSLGALANWGAEGNGPFEGRIQVAEAHINDTGVHVPAGGTNSTFLRGDGSWQAISTSANEIYCTDEFHYSNATNVQDVLDDIDQALLDRAYNASMIACTDEFTYSNSTNVQDVLDDLDNQIGINATAISSFDPSAEEIGVDQTWVAVTRSNGVTYRNTTGKPIMLNVILDGGNASHLYGYIGVSSANTLVLARKTDGATIRITSSLIIPNDHYYRLDYSGQTYIRVVELR